MIDVQPEGARRCEYLAGHIVPCIFPEGDAGVCMRRSTNFTTKLTRYCSLTSEHEGACIYLAMTERDATRDEMRLPVLSF